jgi:site-specific DNA-cytosine methylase
MTKRKDNVTQPKIGLDIFSGAGGLSLGAEMAGIDVSTLLKLTKAQLKLSEEIIKELMLSVTILPNYRQKKS